MTMNMGDMWEAVADQLSDEVAQIHGERRESFREFEERAARLATALRERGIREGAKVAMYVYNAPEYLETCFAAFKLRAVPVNVNYRYLAEELHCNFFQVGSEPLEWEFEVRESPRVSRPRVSPGAKPGGCPGRAPVAGVRRTSGPVRGATR